MAGGRPGQRPETDAGLMDAGREPVASILTNPLIVAEGKAETAALPADVPADARVVLARAVGALVEAGFGFNSTLVEGVVSMQRAWQGPGEDLVMVDAVTLSSHWQALAVREGPTGNPVWGPERGEWSAVVTAILAQPAPPGYARVAARERPASEAREPEVPGSSVFRREHPLMACLDGEEDLDAR